MISARRSVARAASVAALCCSSLFASPSVAQEFAYRLGAVDVIHADEVFELEVGLEVVSLPDGARGPGGWQVALAHRGLAILEATTKGTIADELFFEGFERTEITNGPTNDGFASVVVLSFEDHITLPAEGTHPIARAKYRVTRAGCRDGARIEARDGLHGTGAAVDNLVSWRGTSFPPAIEPRVWSGCELARFGFHVKHDGDRVVVRDEIDRVFQAQVVFTQNAPSARAWSIAVRHDDARLQVLDATLDGTGLDEHLLDDGFVLIELTRGIGNIGVVALIELSSAGAAWLPAAEQALLRLDYRVRRTPAPGERWPTTIELAPSLRGSTGLIENTVTPGGDLSLENLELEVVGYRPPPFVRGDANGDGRIDLGDPISTLWFLFRGGVTICEDAANSNRDVKVDIADVLYTLGWLFLGGAPPPAPYPACGRAGTPVELGCEISACPEER